MVNIATCIKIVYEMYNESSIRIECYKESPKSSILNYIENNYKNNKLLLRYYEVQMHFLYITYTH